MNTAMCCDVVVIGSGAGGGVMAHRLTEMGFKVVLLEAGRYHRRESFSTDFWRTMKDLFWNQGFQYAPGSPSVPVLQGRAVGGTTVINSAISWDLPVDVYEEWLQHDAFEVAYDEIAKEQQRIRKDLHVKTVDPAVQRGNNDVMKAGAEKLGWAAHPTDRNESECHGSARCLLGCPFGAKMSLENSYIPWAVARNLQLISECEAEKIIVDGGRARGVVARRLAHSKRPHSFFHNKGERFEIHAKAVVVSAGVVQSPLLLQRSQVPDPHNLIGSHFMSHPGISVAGLFDQRINLWDGATQGYEVVEFRKKGIKLESIAISPMLFALRLPGIGAQLAELYEKRSHMALWAVVNRAQSRGSVKRGRPLSPIRYDIIDGDVERFLFGIRVTGELLFAAGAREIYPGILGAPEVVRSVEELREITCRRVAANTLHPVATHLFGTCRLSADFHRGVVDTNFQSHFIDGLFVADGSVFPSNIGVNPQLAIMALAGVAANRVARYI